MIEANEINSTFYALRLLSHGLDTSQIEVTDGEEYPASEFTREEQEQALKIIRNIEDSAAISLDQLPPDKIHSYLTALVNRIEELANNDLASAGYSVETSDLSTAEATHLAGSMTAGEFAAVSSMETDDYVCIAPSTPLLKAIEAIKQDKGSCAIVCSDDGYVVGIFTERDFLTKIAGQAVDENAPVSNWMSAVVATLTPEATIKEAVAIMNEKGYQNIPLVKHGKLVGSISVFDIISHLAESYRKTTMNVPQNPDQVAETTDVR